MRGAGAVDRHLFDSTFFAALEGLALPLRAASDSPDDGRRRTPRLGDSLEFADMRAYQPGDDLRLVDWDVYRRFRRLYVRRFQAEHTRSVTLLVDTSGSMGEPAARLRGTLRLAGAAAVLAARRNDRVTLLPFRDDLDERSARTRRGGLPTELLEILSTLRSDGTTAIATALRSLAATVSRGATVVVFSDWYDDHEVSEAIASLRARRCRVCAVIARTAEDRDPPRRGVLELADRETGETVEVVMSRETAVAYRDAFTQWLDGRERAIRRGGGLPVVIDVDEPLERTVRVLAEAMA